MRRGAERSSIPSAFALAAGLLAGLAAAVLPVVPRSEGPRSVWIQADFAYDVSDPTFVAGDATVIVVATVDEEIRKDGDRTLFQVSVSDVLEGEVPQVLNVSQLGFRTDEAVYELEEFPLMTLGKTYIMALVAPSEQEAQDALILLSASGEGNLVEVVDSGDPKVASYRDAVMGQRVPWPAGDDAERQRLDDLRRWQAATPTD